MTIDDIKALIASDESRTLGLKKTTGELKDGMHAACAFLNTDGGWLSWGSGIHRIIEACQEQGVEEPTWRWDGAFVYVTFKRSTKVVSDTGKDSLRGNDTIDRNPESIESKGESKGESNKDKVIDLLARNGELSLPEIASLIGLSLGGVEKIVRQLKRMAYYIVKGLPKQDNG